ncbi:hypothetical protein F2Q69_00015395 [Brassica cretica]|uniref:Uncharacterized protein n=1 Tax=Brassica cretica TaxID=69181 RepID=A0A8S9QUP1_BRACR|nr:hypothetical protein F2Q69_00015395 [Brassica cretica]
MVGVIWLSPGVDQNRNMIKSGKGRGAGHELLGVGPMVGMHVKMRRFSLVWTKIAIWPSWERLWLVKDDPVIGLGWCIEWLGDWLNLLRFEMATRKWGRLVMSPFLELDMGHRRFNRNGTALVQIMRIDRELADGCEPVGSSGQAMGLGNPCGLVLDMTRSGLTVPGHLVAAIGEWV